MFPGPKPGHMFDSALREGVRDRQKAEHELGEVVFATVEPDAEFVRAPEMDEVQRVEEGEALLTGRAGVAERTQIDPAARGGLAEQGAAQADGDGVGLRVAHRDRQGAEPAHTDATDGAHTVGAEARFDPQPSVGLHERLVGALRLVARPVHPVAVAAVGQDHDGGL